MNFGWIAQAQALEFSDRPVSCWQQTKPQNFPSFLINRPASTFPPFVENTLGINGKQKLHKFRLFPFTPFPLNASF